MILDEFCGLLESTKRRFEPYLGVHSYFTGATLPRAVLCSRPSADVIMRQRNINANTRHSLKWCAVPSLWDCYTGPPFKTGSHLKASSSELKPSQFCMKRVGEQGCAQVDKVGASCYKFESPVRLRSRSPHPSSMMSLRTMYVRAHQCLRHQQRRQFGRCRTHITCEPEPLRWLS